MSVQLGHIGPSRIARSRGEAGGVIVQSDERRVGGDMGSVSVTSRVSGALNNKMKPQLALFVVIALGLFVPMERADAANTDINGTYPTVAAVTECSATTNPDGQAFARRDRNVGLSEATAASDTATCFAADAAARTPGLDSERVTIVRNGVCR